MSRLFLTSDRIDILCLVYSNFRREKIISEGRERTFTGFNYYLNSDIIFNLIKLSIKYQSFSKSVKIDSFGQEICFLLVFWFLSLHARVGLQYLHACCSKANKKYIMIQKCKHFHCQAWNSECVIKLRLKFYLFLFEKIINKRPLNLLVNSSN